MLSNSLASLRQRKFLRLLFAGIIISVAVLNTHAQNAAPIARSIGIGTAPFTIKKPGVYVVTKDLTVSATAAAVITIAESAGNVVLDLGGYTLATKAAQNSLNTSIGILVSGSGTITIRNGVVTGFNEGVALGDVVTRSNILVENITATNCGTQGIEGICDSDTTIRRCIILDTGFNTSTTHDGIDIISRNIHISDCRVANTISANNGTLGASGIIVFAASSSVITNCTVTGDDAPRSVGIDVTGNNNDNMVVSNNLFACATGILFAAASGKYEGNLTESCTTPFSGGTSVGTNN